MKNLFFTLALVAATVVSFAQNTTAPANNNVINTMEETPEVNENAPEFEFVEESKDFGEVIEGTKPEHEFWFTNTGNEPLIISNVKASCGCTTPKWSKEPIAPGERGSIKAIYNSKGRMGKFNKAIRITSNAKTETKIVYIKGNVIKETKEETMPLKKPSIVEEKDENK